MVRCYNVPNIVMLVDFCSEMVKMVGWTLGVALSSTYLLKAQIESKLNIDISP